MRHWFGMILALVMAGALFFAGGWGYWRVLHSPLAGGRFTGGGSLLSDHSLLFTLAAIAGTGLLAGLLIAAPRISPLATGLPGLVLLGWTGLYLADVHRAVSLIPLTSQDFGAGFEAMLVTGILGAAGMAMIIPLFVPSRWRARRTEDSQFAEAERADEFLAMLGASDQDDTAQDWRTQLSQNPTAAFALPTSADYPSDPPRPRKAT
jgi:hypothetical protein